MNPRGYLRVVILLTGLLLAATLGLSCASSGTTQSSTTTTPSLGSTTATSAPLASSTTTVPAAASVSQELLKKSLAWMEAAPTKVTYGPYTVTYGAQAKVAELTVAPDVQGEPFMSGPAWWSSDTDYYVQSQPGPPYHVTPAMAVSMTNQTYPGAISGMQTVITIRLLGDPHRLLARSTAISETKLGDGTSRVQVTARAGDLIGPDLPLSTLPATVMPDVGKVYGTTLVLGADGSIKGMTVSLGASPSEATTYTWTRVSSGPSLPRTSIDMDQAMWEQVLASGWRASVAEAAKDLSFPIYSLGDTYLGLALRTIWVDNNPPTAPALLLSYGGPQRLLAPDSTNTSVNPGGPMMAAGGFILFEYSEMSIPESEKGYVANKTLIKTAGEGDGAYSVYKTAKAAPGRSILVKRGETYISIDRTGVGTGDATADLLAAAAALKRAEP